MTSATVSTLCPRCGEATDGWRCAICGAVADEHDELHLHAGSDRYCTLRCAACREADVHCTCV
jgi:tRNA(Ile2) C34 agmatinyltransferase TiaS